MITDESFPKEDLSQHEHNFGQNNSICDRSSSSLLGLEETNRSSSSSGVSSRDKSSETSSDNPEKKKHSLGSEDKDGKGHYFSYQDIHTESTKRRYKHVKSKVAEYIANIKEQERLARKKRKMQRHMSLPNDFNNNYEDSLDSREMLAPSCSCGGQIEELKNLNEYLETNLQQKIDQHYKLRRDLDNLQYEMMVLKDKEAISKKILCRGKSTPSFLFSSYDVSPNTKVHSATQTESERFTFETYHERHVATILPIPISYQKQTDESGYPNTPILRQRSNSNSRTPKSTSNFLNIGDLMIREDIDPNNNNLSTFKSEDESKAEISLNVERRQKKKKKLKTFRKKLAWVLNSCTCSTSHENTMEDYSYTQLPLAEQDSKLSIK